ncbi:endonuclease VII domain-containing protein [Streptomyces anulatus]|uniref:endonuclease VII domain-containing protein n=1 Tax=Streptomyces anulatus TaxID=1892 RepID=UPI003249BB1E
MTSKFCTGCREDKSIEEYSKPWVHYCRPCAGTRAKEHYAARGGADYSYARALRRFYGMTMEEYQARFEAQGGRCAVCREESAQRLHVDHSHQTGAIRELLCEWCNHAIGKARDDPARLRAMADYLERHAQGPTASPASRPEP